MPDLPSLDQSTPPRRKKIATEFLRELILSIEQENKKTQPVIASAPKPLNIFPVRIQETKKIPANVLHQY